MKEVIQILKDVIVDINKNSGAINNEIFGLEAGVMISESDAQKIIDFYERHKGESEPLPTSPLIRPDWSSLDEKFQWVAIDPDGVEIAFIRKPQKLQKYMHGCNAWTGRNCQSTGRFIDMKGIDWTKTLSKRPAK